MNFLALTIGNLFLATQIHLAAEGAKFQQLLIEQESCPCCCERPATPSGPTRDQLDEINRIYKTVPFDQRDHKEVRDLEKQLLEFGDYLRCEVCSNVVGPGIEHPYRHPFKIFSGPEALEGLDAELLKRD